MLSWCHDAEFFCHPAAASQKASEDHLVEIEKSAISKKRSKLWFPSLNTIEVSRENQSRAKKGILVYQNQPNEKRMIRVRTAPINNRFIDTSTQTVQMSIESSQSKIRRVQSQVKDAVDTSLPLPEKSHQIKTIFIHNERLTDTSHRLQSNKQTRSTNFHISQSIKNMLQSKMESEQLFTKDYFDSLQRGFKKDSQEDLSESQKEDEIYSQNNYRQNFQQVDSYHMKAKTNDVSLSQVKDRDSPSRFNINEASLVIAPQLEDKSKSRSKFHLTPQRKAALMDRDTIVSKSVDQLNGGQRSIRVEQSMVFQPQIKSQFQPITKPILCGNTSLYLAIEKFLNFVVSVKEIPCDCLDQISQQNLVYREMNAGQSSYQGVLRLYQTHIDQKSYLFIKEPYLATLKDRLTEYHYLHTPKETKQLVRNVLQKLSQILREAQTKYFYLRRPIQIDDVMQCFEGYKLQSANVFRIGAGHIIPTHFALRRLETQISKFLDALTFLN